MDSGASSHITNDSANLEHINNSYGKNEIFVGNGDKLQVHQTGVLYFPCKNNSKSLKHDQFLHAPKIIKKLISVAQLTSNNNISVEFDSS